LLVKILVLDEADRMLDMGFTRHRTNLEMPTKDKTYCFQQLSKTSKIGHGHFTQPFMWKQLRKTRWMLLSKVYPVPKKKTELIIKLITEGNWKQILVFTYQTRR
jgi:ATP-dependent RNA helicase RhlE